MSSDHHSTPKPNLPDRLKGFFSSSRKSALPTEFHAHNAESAPAKVEASKPDRSATSRLAESTTNAVPEVSTQQPETDKQEVETELKPVLGKLEHFDQVDTASDEVREAYSQLVEATEQLETVLQEAVQQKFEKNPQLKWKLDDSEYTGGIASLTALTRSVQGDQAERETKLGAQVGRFFTSLAPLLSRTFEYAGFAASAAGFAPAETTANGLTKVLELATSPQAQDELVMGGLDKISREDAFLKQLHQFSATDLQDFMLIGAVKLETALMDFLRISIKWLQQNYFKKVWNVVIGREDVKGAVLALETTRSALTTSTIDDTYLLLKRKAVQEEQKKMLCSLCSSEFLEAQLDEWIKYRKKRAADTSLWFLRNEQFSEWCAGAFSLLWCPGLSGAGKSCLTAAVLDHVESYIEGSDIGLAFVFCQRQLRDDQSIDSILGLIIRQLIERKPKLCSKFQSRLTGKSVSREKLKELFSLVLNEYEGAIVVIDALDEFSSDHDVELGFVQTLVDISKPVGADKLRFYATSRPAPDVWQKFQVPNEDSTTIRARDIPIRAPDSDIGLILDKALEDRPQAKKYMAANWQGGTLKSYTIKKIAEKSNGVLILAAKQLERTLRSGNVPKIVNSLENLSSDIDDYYKESMQRIEESDVKDILVRLLTWVFYSKAPLRAHELEFALSIEEDEISSDILTVMAYDDIAFYTSQTEGLIDIPVMRKDRNGIVSPTHGSVSEFFARHPEMLLDLGLDLILNSCVAFWSCRPFDSILPELFCIDDGGWGRDRKLRLDQLLLERTSAEGQPVATEDWDKVKQFAIWACHMPEWLTNERLRRDGDDDKLIKCLWRISKSRSSHSTRSQPLQWCAFNNWSVWCSWLLTNRTGGDIEEYGEEALYDAMTYPSVHTAMVLAAADVIDANSPCHGRRPLVRAVNHELNFDVNDVAQVLIQRSDIKVNEVIEQRRTALHRAAWVNNARGVDILLSHPDVEVDALDVQQATPLMLAVTSTLQPQFGVDKAKDTLTSLLGRSKVDAKDRQGRTALSIAAAYGFKDIKKYRLVVFKSTSASMLSKGLRHIHDYLAWNPVQQLVEAHADINISDKQDHSPLDYARAFDEYVAQFTPPGDEPQEVGVEQPSDEGALKATREDDVLSLYRHLRQSTRATIKYLETHGAKPNTPIDLRKANLLK